MRRDRNIINDSCNRIQSLLIIIKDEYFAQRIFIREKTYRALLFVMTMLFGEVNARSVRPEIKSGWNMSSRD